MTEEFKKKLEELLAKKQEEVCVNTQIKVVDGEAIKGKGDTGVSL